MTQRRTQFTIYGRFQKHAKSDPHLRYLRLSLCVNREDFYWMDFYEVLYFGISLTIMGLFRFWLKPNNNNAHFE